MLFTILQKITNLGINLKLTVMKLKYVSLLLAIPFCLMGHAQENKTVKKETTVKKVVERKGSQVIVKEVKEVDKEKGTVMVEDNEKENQEFNEATTANKNTVVSDNVTIDAHNEAAIMAAKKRQEEALQKSIEAEKEKAMAQKKMLEEQKRAREQEMEANRKKLENRPKGVAKLKSGKGN